MTAINKYNNSKIYKIVSNVSDDVYYGSTTQKLCKRIAEHRTHFKLYLAGKFNYLQSFKLLETGNYDIILVENVNCETKEQLHQRERYYIENNECVNKVVPNRTGKEYYIDNKNKISERHKQFYIDNQVKLLEKHNQYYYDNKIRLLEKHKCECGGKFTTNDKAKHNKSIKHQSYLKELSNQDIKISQQDYDFIFEMDSIFKLPRTYTNIIITN